MKMLLSSLLLVATYSSFANENCTAFIKSGLKKTDNKVLVVDKEAKKEVKLIKEFDSKLKSKLTSNKFKVVTDVKKARFEVTYSANCPMDKEGIIRDSFCEWAVADVNFKDKLTEENYLYTGNDQPLGFLPASELGAFKETLKVLPKCEL